MSKHLSTLTQWQERMQGMEEQIDALRTLLEPAPESALLTAIFAIMGGYTSEIAGRIEWNLECLEDWWMQHRFGERPMQIGFVGEPLRTISTIEELSKFIDDDNERSRQP